MEPDDDPEPQGGRVNRQAKRIERIREIGDKVFCKVLHGSICGVTCHFEFRPTRRAFQVMRDRIGQAVGHAEARIVDRLNEVNNDGEGLYAWELLGDPFGCLIGIERSARQREFERLTGTIVVSPYKRGKLGAALAWHQSRFSCFRRIVDLLPDRRAADRERLKKYLRESRKGAPDPIFFKMIGTVSHDILHKDTEN